MEYYIMTKAEQFYRAAMAKHGLANCISPMIKDIVFDIVEKMEKENLSEIKELQDKIDFYEQQTASGDCAICSMGCPPSDK